MNKWMPILAIASTSACTKRFNTTYKNANLESGRNRDRLPARTRRKNNLLRPTCSSKMSPTLLFSTVWPVRCDMSQKATHYAWEDLATHIAPEVLQAPKSGGD